MSDEMYQLIDISVLHGHVIHAYETKEEAEKALGLAHDIRSFGWSVIPTLSTEKAESWRLSNKNEGFNTVTYLELMRMDPELRDSLFRSNRVYGIYSTGVGAGQTTRLNTWKHVLNKQEHMLHEYAFKSEDQAWADYFGSMKG